MKYLKGFYRMLSALLFWGVALIAVGLCALRVLSFSPYMVLTGSMQPKYPIGSLVYVRKVAQQSLQVGDAITFLKSNGETVVTHEIVAIDVTGGLYYTKGIANDTWDASPAPYENIVGKVYFCIPYMGYLTVPLASKVGRCYVMLALATVWTATWIVQKIFCERK